MPSKSSKRHYLLFLFTLIVLADLGLGSQIVVRDEKIAESQEEVDDLNKKNAILKDSAADNPTVPRFTHRDEDMLADLKESTISDSLKSDVEILESTETEKDDMEIEERYRGPAITLNTDKFINENIEVNADSMALEDKVARNALETNHLILIIILIVVALLAIGLFVTLVVWRNHIHQRYGMRELLVTSDNQDYWPQDVITAAVVAQHSTQCREQQQQFQS